MFGSPGVNFARNNGIPAIRNLRDLNVLNRHHLFAPRAKSVLCQKTLLERALHPRDSAGKQSGLLHPHSHPERGPTQRYGWMPCSAGE